MGIVDLLFGKKEIIVCHKSNTVTFGRASLKKDFGYWLNQNGVRNFDCVLQDLYNYANENKIHIYEK